MYKLVVDEKLLQYADLMIEQDALISIDTETNGLFPLTDKVVGFSFSWKKGYAVYVPVRHVEGTNCPYPIVVEFMERIKKLKIVFHNAKFDKSMIFTSFGKALPIHADTMLYAYLAGEPKGLKDLSLKHLNVMQRHFEDIMKSKFGQKWKSEGYNMSHIPADDVELLQYAAEDADFTLQLYHILKPKMEPFKSILKIEENLIDTVIKMNMTGAPIDKGMLELAIIDYEASVQETYFKITDIAGRAISINSPVDLASYLFGTLKLPVIERSKKTGAPSTSKEVLAELMDMHPVVELIDAWRKDSRMLKAYLQKIPAGLDERNRIFTEFDSMGAVSGRFTSSSLEDSSGLCRGLNLQNIPKHKKRAVDMRKAFIAPEGWTFVKADYSQIEYRVMACLSKDQFMCEAFRRGLDFHTFAAANMYEINAEDVTPEQRDKGKVFNFGLSFGMSAKGLAMRLGCSEEEAERKIEAYFARVPGLVNCINATKQRALNEQCTYTFFGRRRPLVIDGLPQRARDQMLRKSFNTMVQGTAADILKIALLRVTHNVLKGRKDIELCMTVHDELCFIVKDESLQELLPMIKRAMEIPTPADWVPIIAEIGYGENWSEECHTAYKPEDFKQEEFTSWAAILPAGLKVSI